MCWKSLEYSGHFTAASSSRVSEAIGSRHMADIMIADAEARASLCQVAVQQDDREQRAAPRQGEGVVVRSCHRGVSGDRLHRGVDPAPARPALSPSPATSSAVGTAAGSTAGSAAGSMAAVSAPGAANFHVPKQTTYLELPAGPEGAGKKSLGRKFVQERRR